MQHKNDLTYSEAIEQVMLNNGYFAPLRNNCQFSSYEQVENDYKLAISKTYL